MSITVKGNTDGIATRWRGAIKITAADATYALQRQRTRILERTARGVDVEGRGFKPYSTKGPYTYYPNARVGTSKFTDRQNRAAASRLKRALEKKPQKAGGMRLTRPGKGIVFDSYAAFKRWLGRTGVDLRGPRAPHMLQAIVVKVANAVSGAVREARLGIYGAEGPRAAGHNKGTRRLPRRKFMGASAADRRAIVADIMARIKGRLGLR